MTRKVFIVNNQYHDCVEDNQPTLTIVTTTDAARYVDHYKGEILLPIMLGNLGIEAIECEGIWIGQSNDDMFDADARTKDEGNARFWAERKCVA